MSELSLMNLEENSNEEIYDALVKDNKAALESGDYDKSITLTLLMDKINSLIDRESRIEKLEEELEERIVDAVDSQSHAVKCDEENKCLKSELDKLKAEHKSCLLKMLGMSQGRDSFGNTVKNSLIAYLQKMIFQIVFDHNYGSPDSGNDEGIDMALTYCTGLLGNCEFETLKKALNPPEKTHEIKLEADETVCGKCGGIYLTGDNGKRLNPHECKGSES